MYRTCIVFWFRWRSAHRTLLWRSTRERERNEFLTKRILSHKRCTSRLPMRLSIVSGRRIPFAFVRCAEECDWYCRSPSCVCFAMKLRGVHQYSNQRVNQRTDADLADSENVRRLMRAHSLINTISFAFRMIYTRRSCYSPPADVWSVNFSQTIFASHSSHRFVLSAPIYCSLNIHSYWQALACITQSAVCVTE